MLVELIFYIFGYLVYTVPIGTKQTFSKDMKVIGPWRKKKYVRRMYNIHVHSYLSEFRAVHPCWNFEYSGVFFMRRLNRRFWMRAKIKGARQCDEGIIVDDGFLKQCLKSRTLRFYYTLCSRRRRNAKVRFDYSRYQGLLFVLLLRQ